METDRYKGFTLVEILVVLAIIALLLGILLPALSQIKKIAANTKQKAQISSIEIGLSLYKNDFGEYPPSHGWKTGANSDDYTYSGAHTLAEAMVGYDLLGVHPDTVYRADGYDAAGSSEGRLYPLPRTTPTKEPNDINLNKRKGPYLDRTNIGVFEPNQIFDTATNPLYATTLLKKTGHMICDVFPVKSAKIGNKKYQIGTPILYFWANLAAENMQSIASGPNPEELIKNIYNYADNIYLLNVGKIVDGKNHAICPFNDDVTGANKGRQFYNFIRDPMVTMPTVTDGHGRPVKPDSYLLISAGWDGIYGTSDDICNFEPNIE